MVVGGCRVGRYETEQTPLWWAANDGQVETARRLLAGRDGRGGVEVDLARASDGITPLVQAASQNFTAVVELLLEYPRRCEQGEIRWFHSTLVRRANGLRPGGHVAPCKGRRCEQGGEGWADAALRCQRPRPQGRGGDATRRGR